MELTGFEYCNGNGILSNDVAFDPYLSGDPLVFLCIFPGLARDGSINEK